MDANSMLGLGDLEVQSMQFPFQPRLGNKYVPAKKIILISSSVQFLLLRRNE